MKDKKVKQVLSRSGTSERGEGKSEGDGEPIWWMEQ
jgi:hypothetical protein